MISIPSTAWYRERRRELLEASPGVILAVTEQLLVGYQMKKVLRYRSERDGTQHSESNAEHEWALLYLSEFFLPLEDTERVMDLATVHRILLFHDFGEIGLGDEPYHLKGEEQKALERENAPKVFERLPKELYTIGMQAWLHYEDRSTLEAEFVDALDKIEPLFELRNPVAEQSLQRLQFTYQHHIEKKRLATKKFPVMRRFVEVISDEMRARNVFWVTT